MKKTFKTFSILILVLTILIISKNEQKNSYAYVNKLVENGNFEVTQEKNSIKKHYLNDFFNIISFSLLSFIL